MTDNCIHPTIECIKPNDDDPLCDASLSTEKLQLPKFEIQALDGSSLYHCKRCNIHMPSDMFYKVNILRSVRYCKKCTRWVVSIRKVKSKNTKPNSCSKTDLSKTLLTCIRQRFRVLKAEYKLRKEKPPTTMCINGYGVDKILEFWDHKSAISGRSFATLTTQKPTLIFWTEPCPDYISPHDVIPVTTDEAAQWRKYTSMEKRTAAFGVSMQARVQERLLIFKQEFTK